MMLRRAIQLMQQILDTLLSWPLFLHLLLVLSAAWLAGYLHFNYLFSLLSAILYLHRVDSLQKERLKKQIEHRLQQDKTLRLRTETETVRWLNVLLQDCWLCWLERYISKSVADCLLYSLNSYKPRAVSKFLVDRLRLGHSPPLIHSIKVIRNPNSEEHTILEIDFSFVAADDMRLDLVACLGFGLTGKFYANNLVIEGKLRLGCKFVPYYPYVGQLSVAFVSAPNLKLSVRPLSSNSVDLTDLPGIASWVSKAVQEAVETYLVEPYPFVLDLIRMFGAEYILDTEKDGIKKFHLGSGILNEKREASSAILEILEGKDLVAKDRSGFSDPYVKIKMDKIKFTTSVKKQTLNPQWHELFRFQVTNWHLPTKVFLRVRDRDTFGKDDELGWQEINLVQLRGGDRRDMWLKLQDAKSGLLHIAVTVLEPAVSRSPQDVKASLIISSTLSVAIGTGSGVSEAKKEDVTVHHNCQSASAENVGIKEHELIVDQFNHFYSNSTTHLPSESKRLTLNPVKKDTCVHDNFTKGKKDTCVHDNFTKDNFFADFSKDACSSSTASNENQSRSLAYKKDAFVPGKSAGSLVEFEDGQSVVNQTIPPENCDKINTHRTDHGKKAIQRLFSVLFHKLKNSISCL